MVLEVPTTTKVPVPSVVEMTCRQIKPAKINLSLFWRVLARWSWMRSQMARASLMLMAQVKAGVEGLACQGLVASKASV